MLIFAALSFMLGIAVLTVRRPAERLNPSVLYRLDRRVVATVLFILCGCFLILGYSELRTLLR